MKRGTVDKMIAGVGTVGFMALVTTNANPKMWQISLIAVLLYESALLAIKTARRATRSNNRRKVEKIRKDDAARWAEQWFNPYKGVSA